VPDGNRVRKVIMDPRLSDEELRCLRELDTDALEKPDLPPAIAEALVEKGLAIRLVEGGLQMTALGREYLSRAADRNR
jgi:hypothetical protein